MSMNMSRVIENKLRFLALTRAGKIRLSVFSDKVLYKALSLFQRTYYDMPDNPFNIYYAYCVLESQRLELPPNWDEMEKFPNFDPSGDVTLREEQFNMKKCHEIMNDFSKRKAHSNSYGGKQSKSCDSNQAGQRGGSATFNRGIMYYKYGNWYKYPDQKWCRDSRPSLPVSSSQAKWLRDKGLCPKKELQKALDNKILSEDQISIFHLYESPIMKEFLSERNKY